MTILSKIFSWFGIRASQPQRPPPMPVIGALPGGRASVDTSGTFPTAMWLFVPPDNYETNWQLLTIDSKALERISPTQLMELLADLSPEVSSGLWHFQRLCNPGYAIQCYAPGSETEDARATKAIADFIDVLERRYTTFDIVIGRLYTGAFLRGAFCAELVLDEAGRLPVDFATPDPTSIRFRRKSDPVLGQIWQPGQWQAYDFVPLDRETFCYAPIDPMPGKPYGRPLAAPALFTSLFLLGMLHDLKRVIQQQGYPRIDIIVDIEQLVQLAPQIASNAEAFTAFTQQIVSSVEDAYRQLKPDDAYIHTSNISVNRPVGTADTGSLGGLDAVIKMLERMNVRALKSMPFMFGIDDRLGDIQANRQFELFSAGIRSLQNQAETMLERLFKLALEAQGIQADVVFTFEEFRASEELRDAQAEQLQIANEVAKVAAGWITDDEASETVTGHKAQGTKAPPVAPQPAQQPGVGNTDGGEAVQQPQQNNAVWLNEIRAARAEVAQAMERISSNGYHAPN